MSPTSLYHHLHDICMKLNLGEGVASILSHSFLIVAIFVICWIANIFARSVLLANIQRLTRRTKNTWDDVVFDHKVFDRLSHLAPAIVLYYSHRLYPADYEGLRALLVQASLVYMVLIVARTVFAFLNAVQSIYSSYEFAKGRPIKGYLQAVKVFLALVTLVLTASLVVNQSPVILLSGMGALTAVMLLVFKDTILGVVAGIQIAGNNLVQVGDWIVVPGADADGDVVDVSLTTVKVQNWDKTITSVPIYSLVSQAFTNWRGMYESGGRRIKRHINLDLNTVGFADDMLLERLASIDILSERIQDVREQIKDHQGTSRMDPNCPFNAPRPTNAGLFRDYAAAFLRGNDNIHQSMTFLVRQLQPSDMGLPIEIYVFCKDQRWVQYENIQGEIFDHLLAVLPHFDLRAFQRPSGHDVIETRSPTLGQVE